MTLGLVLATQRVPDAKVGSYFCANLTGANGLILLRKISKTVDICAWKNYHFNMFLEDGTIRHRRRSLNLPNHAHEVTFSCYRGYKLLSRDRTCQWLVDALDRARSKHEFEVWSYVIMPEHAHLLILPLREEYKMDVIFKSIKESVSRRATNFLRRTNPRWLERLTVRYPDGRIERHFWQPGGGYDRNIVTQRALVSSIYYLHANPVRRGLVANPVDWKWSSARWYTGCEDVRMKMDATRLHLSS